MDRFGGWHKDSLEVITKLGRHFEKEEEEIMRQLKDLEIRMTATPGEGAHITFWTELVAKHAHQTYLQWLSNITMQS